MRINDSSISKIQRRKGYKTLKSRRKVQFDCCWLRVNVLKLKFKRFLCPNKARGVCVRSKWERARETLAIAEM